MSKEYMMNETYQLMEREIPNNKIVFFKIGDR